MYFFDMKTVKVIHIHFLTSHKNYYFGSVRGIFKKFSEAEIGCTENYLSHRLNADGKTHITAHVLAIRSHLIR